MTQPWGQYIYDSGHSYNWFLRDAVHMNGRGMAVAGRILQSYFTPVPEPGSLGLLTVAVLGLLRRRRKQEATR
jgi:ABC-type cobalamin transport system permease subunit